MAIAANSATSLDISTATKMPARDRERRDKPLRQHGIEIICNLCRGKGWTPPAMLNAAKARVAQESPIVPTGRAYVGSSGG